MRKHSFWFGILLLAFGEAFGHWSNYLLYVCKLFSLLSKHICYSPSSILLSNRQFFRGNAQKQQKQQKQMHTIWCNLYCKSGQVLVNWDVLYECPLFHAVIEWNILVGEVDKFIWMCLSMNDRPVKNEPNLSTINDIDLIQLHYLAWTL